MDYFRVRDDYSQQDGGDGCCRLLQRIPVAETEDIETSETNESNKKKNRFAVCWRLCDEYKNGKYVVDPRTSTFLPAWDAILIVLVLVTAFRVPFLVGFCLTRDHGVPSSTIDLFINIFFLSDIFLQNFIMSPDPVNHRWIRLPPLIAKQYRDTFLLLDVISVVPYGWCTRFVTDFAGDDFRILGISKVFSLVKLLRVNRIITRYISRVGVHMAWTKLCKLMVLLAMSLHWLACGWGLLLNVEKYFGWNKGSTWDEAVQAAKPFMFESDVSETPFEMWTISLYWSCMTITSIGYGDVTATNTLEAWGCILMMGGCGVIWASIIGDICGITGSLDAENVAQENQLDSLNTMLETFQMPQEMRMQLREFFMRRGVMYHRDKQVELLRLMSPDLQGIVARWVQKTLLEKISAFTVSNDGFVVGLFERFQFAMYPPRELLILPGCLVCLRSGVALLKAKVLPPGSVWGIADLIVTNPALWENSKPLALSYVEAQYLTRRSLEQLTMKYPEERAHIRKCATWLALRYGVLRGKVKMEQLAVTAPAVRNSTTASGSAGRTTLERSTKVVLESKLEAMIDLATGGRNFDHSSEINEMMDDVLSDLRRVEASAAAKAKQEGGSSASKPAKVAPLGLAGVSSRPGSNSMSGLKSSPRGSPRGRTPARECKFKL